MKSPNSLCQALSPIKSCAELSFKKCILVIVLLVSSHGLLSQQLAFPTAQGAGAYIKGGRGGIVVRVTNLNNSGSGSLREALLMTVPRTIVFDVSGKINLTSLLEIPAASSNFTVAGQTAPQGGITITGRPIQMGASLPNSVNVPCNNAIWRYIRFRNGSYTGVSDLYEHNGFISVGTDGLILDHCSFSFCDDQAISMDSYYGDLKNITIQRSLFSENATQIITGLQGSYPRGNMTFINNLFADTSQRTPNMGGNLQWDLINNVYFNWVSRLSNANNGDPKINNIGNYLKKGSYTSNDGANKVQNGAPLIYSAYNYHTTLHTIPVLNDIDLWTKFSDGSALSSSYFTSTRHPLLGAAPNIQTASATYTDVMNDVGANAYLNADGTFGTYQDSFDTKKIGNVLSNISSDPYNKNWTQPTLPLNTRNGTYDTDNDGMPNTWEIANGLNPNNASDGNTVQPNGYTNLEHFLNGMTLQDVQVTANAGADVAICSGNSTTLTATGGATYRWNTGATSASITVSPSSTTTYTVTVADATGVNSDTDDVVVTVKSMPAANAGGDVSTCRGTGVSLTASGGGSYLWSTGATTASISVNPTNTTTYSVEVTQNGCTDTDEVKVTVIPLPSVTAGTDVTINLGQSATLSATGASTYTWNTGVNGSSIDVSPTVTTTYTVTGTNNNGCSETDTVKVIVQTGDVLNANAGTDVAICSGTSTTLTVTGGTTYLWSNGATTASITVSPNTTTTYTVTAYDSSGLNSDTDDVKVSVNPLPSVNAGADVTINLGQSVTLTATGASTYAWNTGATGSTINVSPTVSTTYTVTGTNTNGCSKTDMVTVNVQTGNTVSAYAGVDVSICSGTSTTLTVTGGTTYLWSNGATTASITVSPNTTTTYTVTAYDSSGLNSDTDDVKVSVNPLPSVNAGADLTINPGQSVTLTATGASTYAWNTGATGSTINVSPTVSTTYTVTGSNTNGCSKTDMVTVNVQTGNTVSAYAGVDVSICSGTSTTLTVTGGTTYLWSNGATTASITVSPNTTTTYTVTAYDSSGIISGTDDVKVVVNALPTANAGQDVTTCRGTSVTLTATGGGSYLWSNGATSASITVNPNNTTTYSVEVTKNGCTATDDVKVTVSPLPSVNAGTDVTITLDQSVTLTVAGASAYIWSTGATGTRIVVSPTETTTYTVTGTNANGCSKTDTVTVNVVSGESVTMNANAGADVSICSGNTTTLTATGGSTYLWSNGATTASITVSPNTTTTYSVTVFDATGVNSDTDDVKVTVNPLPSVNAGTDVTINLGHSVTLNATGAVSYMWNTGETSPTLDVRPDETTTYTVTGTSSNGCSTSDSIIVHVQKGNSLKAYAGEDVSICSGNSTVLTATGGASYLWSNGATTASITVSPNTTTTYTVMAYDDTTSFSDTDDVKVSVNQAPSIDVGPDFTISFGQAVTLYALGGTSYVWSTGETTNSLRIAPTETTTYSVVGTKNGCEGTARITITVVNASDFVGNAGANKSTCQSYGVTLTATGGDRYLWSTGETSQSIVVNPNSTTNYTVIAYTRTAEITDEVTVTVNPNPVVEITNGREVTILQGEYITLSASGASRYEWNNGANLANIAVNPSTTTTFTVTGFTGDCSANKGVRVNVVPVVLAFAGNNRTICKSEQVTLTASGGDEFLWNTGATTASITVSPEEDTEYSVTVYNNLDYDEANVMVYVNNCTENTDGSENLEYFEFLAYPNPTAGELNIKISGLLNVSNIALYDLSGKMLFQESISNDTQQHFVKKLDLSPYSDGLYLLRLVDGTHSVTKKIVIHK